MKQRESNRCYKLGRRAARLNDRKIAPVGDRVLRSFWLAGYSDYQLDCKR